MTNPKLLLGAIASTKAEIKRHEDALQVLMDDLALMYASGELDDLKDGEGNLVSDAVKVSRSPDAYKLALQQCREGTAAT